MIKKLIINIEITEDKNIRISNGEHGVIIDKSVKTINAHKIYDLLDYNIDNEYIQSLQKIEGEGEETRDTIRLFNYTIDLIDSIIKGVNDKSVKLRGEKSKVEESDSAETSFANIVENRSL